MFERMKRLNIHDQRQLEAAEGWLGLGNLQEANAELEQLSPDMRRHPEVLNVRWQIQAMAREWESAIEIARAIAAEVPDSPLGWIHLAYALHELKRTQESYAVAKSVVNKFPNEPTLRYNLACYACQLGNHPEALVWLTEAAALKDKAEIVQLALDDPDLKPLQREIRKL